MATEALQQHSSVDVAALRKHLLRHWNTTDFRPQQLEAVQATLKVLNQPVHPPGKKCLASATSQEMLHSQRLHMQGLDVLLILPTGGGKSLCFHLPPLTQPNALTIIISPLISLATDQVRGLCKDLACWQQLSRLCRIQACMHAGGRRVGARH